MKATCLIPVTKIERLEKKVAQMNRKASKLGVAPFQLIPTGFKETKTLQIDTPEGKVRTAVEFIEFTLSGETIKLNGWEFIAAIDHENFPNYNVVKNLKESVDVSEYRDLAPSCEHCGYNRRRRNTYIVYHSEMNETKQVGSTCVRDFTGHKNAEAVLNMFQSFFEWFTTRASEYGTSADFRVDTNEIVRVCAELILKQGFISKKYVQENDRDDLWTTADEARHIWGDFKLWKSFTENDLTEKGKALALYVFGDHLDFLKSLTNPSEFDINVRNFLSDESFQIRYVAFVAAAVNSAHRKLNNPKPKKKAPNAFIGKVGEQMTVPLVCVSGTGYSSQFGYGTRYSLTDKAGNRVTWFTSGSVELEDGNIYEMKFRVKDHNDWKGMKSTVITRAKIQKSK